MPTMAPYTRQPEIYLVPSKSIHIDGLLLFHLDFGGEDAGLHREDEMLISEERVDLPYQ